MRVIAVKQYSSGLLLNGCCKINIVHVLYSCFISCLSLHIKSLCIQVSKHQPYICIGIRYAWLQICLAFDSEDIAFRLHFYTCWHVYLLYVTVYCRYQFKIIKSIKEVTSRCISCFLYLRPNKPRDANSHNMANTNDLITIGPRL